MENDIVEFITVAAKDEIAEGASKPARIGEHDVVVFNHGGNFYALRRWCTHMGGDLSEGAIEGNVVTCPRHGSQFDITTGKNLRGPKMGPIQFPSTADELTYQVKVEGNDILVGVEDKNMMP
ncbi:Rieske 2Fe-2S domain-containing protein [Dehalogenimonas sp. THU2]|uniref:Rieske (2Fe-2S) protein n=1 Tax=Dehalogenimonas sp. THU2 TaxID=3151121 RepID=UPI003218A036